MSKFVNYLGLVMAAVYLLFGSYLLFGPYVLQNPMVISNGSILGGLLIGYGIFRIYRFMNGLGQVS